MASTQGQQRKMAGEAMHSGAIPKRKKKGAESSNHLGPDLVVAKGCYR
jgi:hypothetical protein